LAQEKDWTKQPIVCDKDNFAYNLRMAAEDYLRHKTPNMKTDIK
jgi:hypothetical protein